MFVYFSVLRFFFFSTENICMGRSLNLNRTSMKDIEVIALSLKQLKYTFTLCYGYASVVAASVVTWLWTSLGWLSDWIPAMGQALCTEMGISPAGMFAPLGDQCFWFICSLWSSGVWAWGLHVAWCNLHSFLTFQPRCPNNPAKEYLFNNSIEMTGELKFDLCLTLHTKNNMTCIRCLNYEIFRGRKKVFATWK